MLNASLLSREYFMKLLNGGVTAINYTIAMNHNKSETIKRILDLKDLVKENGDVSMLVKSSGYIYKAKREGKVGIILGFQNVTPLEGDLRMPRLYKDIGVNIIQLSYHFRNIAAASCKERTDAGLSDWGIELVKEVNNHNSVSFKPCALLDTYQNKSDEEIEALAKKRRGYWYNSICKDALQ